MNIAIDLLGNEFTVLPCNIDDIDLHFSKVKFGITNKLQDKFKDRMIKSIKNNTAFKLEDNSCFIYYLKTTTRIADGVAIYGEDVSNKLLALLITVFNDIDPNTVKLDFYPHSEKQISKYKSLITLSSIKKQIIPNKPLTVRIDKLKNKINNMYKKRSIK